MADDDNLLGEKSSSNKDNKQVDPRVLRAIQCVREIVYKRNLAFEDELRSLLAEIILDPKNTVLIADFADGLADPASFGNMTSQLLDRFILHLDAEISLEVTRAHKHAEAKSGFWTFLTGGTLSLGVGASVAPLWMAVTAPFAPWVGVGLIAISGVCYWRRRVSSDLEDEANTKQRGLDSMRRAIERRRG